MNCWVLFCCLKNGNEQQKVLDQKKIMCLNGEKMSYGTKKDTIHKRPQIFHQAILDTILRKTLIISLILIFLAAWWTSTNGLNVLCLESQQLF